MVVEISRRSILPPSGRREEVSWRSRSRKRYGGGTVVKFAMRDISLGFSLREVNIGQRRAPGGGPATKATWWCGQEGARARCPARRGVAPLWPTLVLPETSVTLIFIYFSWNFPGSKNCVKSVQLKDISR